MTKPKIIDLIVKRKQDTLHQYNTKVSEAEMCAKGHKVKYQEKKTEAKILFACYEQLDSILDQIRA